MKKSFFLFILGFPLLINMGCCKNVHKITKAKYESLNIIGDIYCFKVEKIEEEKRRLFNISNRFRSYVYAYVEVKNNSDNDVMFNLNEIRLDSNGLISSNIYVDGGIDYIIMDQTIGPNKELRSRVYWYFDSVLKINDIENLELVVQGQ